MGFIAEYNEETSVFTISFNGKVIEEYEDAETRNANLKFHDESYRNVDKYYEYVFKIESRRFGTNRTRITITRDHWTTDIMRTTGGFQHLLEPPQPYHVRFEAYMRKSMEELIEEFERCQKLYAETFHYKEFSKEIQNLSKSGKSFSKVVVLGVGSLHRAAYVKGNRWMPPTMVCDIQDAVLVATTLGGMFHLIIFPFRIRSS
jgi:hypothetical protein